MTPPFACFPVCMTLSTIGLIAAVMVVFNLGNRIPGDDQPPDPSVAALTDQPMGPPPLWVLPVMMLVLLVVMLILGWYWPE